MDQPDPRDDATRAESLGRTIKLYRTAWDMSRKELAEKAGLSYSYVSEIENGGKHPSTKALHLIALGAYALAFVTWRRERHLRAAVPSPAE